MHFVTKTFNPEKGYSCAFRQHRAMSHCKLLHGYDLQFGITLGANKLDENGWVFDFGGLKEVQREIEHMFDHTVVIAADDPEREAFDDLHIRGGLDLRVLPHVGCEAFASWLMQRTQDRLSRLGESKRVVIMSTTVREHGANLAGWVNPKFAGIVGIA